MTEVPEDRKIGYFCTYTPKELIKAAGFTPVRVLAGDNQISSASEYIQTYCCSQVKGSLERALDSDLNVEGVIFTRTCDSVMRLTDIWKRSTDTKVYNLEFPTNIDENAKEYFKRELFDFKKKLENWSDDEITVKNLKDSISSYSRLEILLKKIFDLKPNYELVLEIGKEKVETAIGKARKKLNQLKEGKSDLSDNKVKALLTGSVCPDPKIFTLIRNTGFRILDDLCTGSRFFEANEEVDNQAVDDLKSTEDCMNFLVDKYFQKSPCPTKHFNDDRRFDYLLKKAENASVVIFLLLKFCEPHFFDYPHLKKRLEDRGKKTLLLELEFPISSYGQLKTRLEALYEMVDPNE